MEKEGHVLEVIVNAMDTYLGDVFIIQNVSGQEEKMIADNN